MLKPELQAKFLNHLNKKKKGTEGFTLIELLVVIIIIGVLAAIALPSLLNQVNKARQSEARQNVGAMNRAQQAYYLENSNQFGTSVGDLAIGIKTQTSNYLYEISSTNANSVATNKGRAIATKLKSYAGIVYSSIQPVTAGGVNVNEALTQATLCESIEPAPDNTSNTTPFPVGEGSNTGDCIAVGNFKQIK